MYPNREEHGCVGDCLKQYSKECKGNPKHVKVIGNEEDGCMEGEFEFDYCNAAIQSDRKNGFNVEIINHYYK